MKLSTAKRIQSIGSLIVVGTMLLDVASYFVEHLLAYLLGTAAELPAVMALVEDPAHDLSECSNQQLARWSVEALKDVRAS